MSRIYCKLVIIRLYQIGGFISRNDSLLKYYGICVLPSFLEPFGKTILEAVLRNKLIVVTNSGGICLLYLYICLGETILMIWLANELIDKKKGPI